MCLSSSIALGDMISEEDIFVGKISLLVLAIILCGALLFSIVVMYRRHTQEYLSELNTDQLLGATMTLQQFHHQRNGIIRNSGVCSICMVRQLHKLWPTPPPGFAETDGMCTMVSGTTKRNSRIAYSGLFTLLPPTMHQKMGYNGTLFKRRERRVPAVQIRYCN